MQNFDELAEKYLGAVEKQKVSEGKAVDSFSRGGYGDNPCFRFDAISDIQHFFYQESRCPMPLKLKTE